LEASKEQELLGYLLIWRNRCHPRETLANLLWGDSPTDRSKKYLRQTLWRLQVALESGKSDGPQVLTVEHDWVQLNLGRGLWLDVAMFEQAFANIRPIPGNQLDSSSAELLKAAVELYKGDLLDGWYQDWCLFERERLQNIYLSSLAKLMTYSEKHREYETGFDYGLRILRYDRAHERTHRQLMHLQFMAGDRTGALRQYERCVAALEEELGVKPDRRTTTLYEQIRADRLNYDEPIEAEFRATLPAPLPEALNKLKRLELVLGAVHKRIQRNIKEVERGLKTMKQ
jgi:DNA-binding SARP family transcriptional activator